MTALNCLVHYSTLHIHVCGKTILCGVGLYAEQFYAIVPSYLVSLLFADLLSLHLITFIL